MRISDWSSDVCSSDLCRETAIGERRPAPAIWLHHVIGRVRNRAMVADIEYASALILIGRKTGMLAVDVGGPIIGEGGAPAHAAGEFGHDPPVRLRLAEIGRAHV